MTPLPQLFVSEYFSGKLPEDHATTEEISQVHSLSNETTAKHEEGVGEEVGGVQKTKVCLGLALCLSIDLAGTIVDP